MAQTNYLLNHDSLVKDKVVLEIGAGCALPGITAGLLGAKVVILTDMPEQMSHLQQNVDLNSKQCPSCQFICVSFMFGDSMEDLLSQLQQHIPPLSMDLAKLSIDVVLGCDVAYDVSLHDPIVSSLHSLLLPTSMALLVEEVRWKDIYNWFVESLTETTPSTPTLHCIAGRRINIVNEETEGDDSNMSEFKKWYLANMPIINNRDVQLNVVVPSGFVHLPTATATTL